MLRNVFHEVIKFSYADGTTHYMRGNQSGLPHA